VDCPSIVHLQVRGKLSIDWRFLAIRLEPDALTGIEVGVDQPGQSGTGPVRQRMRPRILDRPVADVWLGHEATFGQGLILEGR